MKTLDLQKFENPWDMVSWLCVNWGPPGKNSDRWDLRELHFLDIFRDQDVTFLLLKWNFSNDNLYNG